MTALYGSGLGHLVEREEPQELKRFRKPTKNIVLVVNEHNVENWPGHFVLQIKTKFEGLGYNVKVHPLKFDESLLGRVIKLGSRKAFFAKRLKNSRLKSEEFVNKLLEKTARQVARVSKENPDALVLTLHSWQFAEIRNLPKPNEMTFKVYDTKPLTGTADAPIYAFPHDKARWNTSRIFAVEFPAAYKPAPEAITKRTDWIREALHEKEASSLEFHTHQIVDYNRMKESGVYGEQVADSIVQKIDSMLAPKRMTGKA